MSKYVLAFDQSATSSRALLFDRAGNVCASAQQGSKHYYPQPAWVEHDPKEIWLSQRAVERSKGWAS